MVTLGILNIQRGYGILLVKLYFRKYGPKNREAEMSWKTVYNNTSKAKSFGGNYKIFI